MVVYTLNTTAHFDACTKAVTSDNFNVETISDNLRVSANRAQIMSMLSDTMSRADGPDVGNWKWTTGFLRNHTSAPGVRSTTIAGGKATVSAAPTAGLNTYGMISSKLLTSVFDIQVDLTGFTLANLTIASLFIIKDPAVDNDFVYIGTYRDGGGNLNIVSYAVFNGAALINVTTIGTATKLRILRFDEAPAHHYVETYYDLGGGAGWVQQSVHDSCDNVDNDNLYFCLAVRAPLGTTAVGEFDNLIVNSGTTSDGTPYVATGVLTAPTDATEYAMPANHRLKSLYLSHSGMNANCTIIPKILDNAGAALWTGAAITANGSTTFTPADFGNIREDFRIELDYASDSSTEPGPGTGAIIATTEGISSGNIASKMIGAGVL